MFAREEVVLVTKGRHAGKKGVVLKEPYKDESGRLIVLVAGLAKAPRTVTEDMTEKSKKRRRELVAFVRPVNVRHALATRHTLENVFDKLEVKDTTDTAEKKAMLESISKLFGSVYKNNPGHWIFKKQAV